MPGITGIIRRTPKGDESALLDKMLEDMKHEPFYTSTRFTDEELGVYAGSTAFDGDFSDCMPVFNEKKDIILLFSGECFTDGNDIADLERRGHECNGGDAGYLVHLYEEKGDDFLSDLNGWFSGLLVDKSRKRLLLFNDRYAAHKRIYFRELGNDFYFSSEAKALLRLFPDSREFDGFGLGEYFLCDCALEQKTYFKDIHLMPGASAWVFSRGKITRGSYFDPASWENQPKMERKAFHNALKQTFKQVLPRYFPEKNMGLSLTGGLDTRMIISGFHPAPGELPCYTFGGMYRDSYDVRVSEKIARVYGQEMQVIRTDSRFLSDFATHAARSIYITDGLAISDITDEMYINRLARDIAPVRMTGKFGSQVMRGVSILRARPPDSAVFDGGFLEYIEKAGTVFKRIKEEAHLSFILFKELPWYWGGSSTAEASQLTVRSPFLDNDLVKLMFRFPDKHGFVGPDFQLETISEYDPRLSGVRTDRGLGGGGGILRRKARLQYNKFWIGGDRLYNWELMPDGIARLEKAISFTGFYKLFVGRQKFRHYRKWFRDELGDYVKDLLLDEKTLQRPFWNRKAVEKIVLDHTGGRANHYTTIRKLITVELIQRHLLDSLEAP